MYTPETSCMKVTSVHIKNVRIKQLCNHKVKDFATGVWLSGCENFWDLRATGPRKYSTLGWCPESMSICS